MGTSTFSGPLRSGTIKEGPVENLGVAVLSQNASVAAAAAAAVTSSIIIPANSSILELLVDVTVVFNGTTGPFTIGSAAGGSQYASGVATTAGRIVPTYTTAQLVAMQATLPDTTGSPNSTVYLTVTPTGANTTGAVLLGLIYRQN